MTSVNMVITLLKRFRIAVQVSLDKSDALVVKNPSGLSRIRVNEGYFSRKSRIRRPKIVRVIEGPTYRSPTYRGTPVQICVDNSDYDNLNLRSPGLFWGMKTFLEFVHTKGWISDLMTWTNFIRNPR